MIIAGILFLIGLLIGLSHGYPAIILASAAVTLVAFPTWVIRGEFGLFVVLVWIGYLFALQAGFMLGSYLGLSDEEQALPEPDRAPREEAKPRPPQDGEAGPEQDRGE
ncbi:MAG: hypothetical protein J0I42_21415 [Bosea sp.]|uniref:hypothetical protein n=1 Tax=Bosea sp. (in: a-proteobacteria) TaxID=1871050 RepID=UPI001AD0A7CA|nr:hypothetical protein [Bosea sp. (in: a-proteobacteria)]MBN9454504.1 hypothetical protein [Bosea sp. (in: a-proteobacteria)]